MECGWLCVDHELRRSTRRCVAVTAYLAFSSPYLANVVRLVRGCMVLCGCVGMVCLSEAGGESGSGLNGFGGLSVREFSMRAALGLL